MVASASGGDAMTSEQLQSLAVTILVVVLMFGVGLRTRPEAYRRVIARPWWLLMTLVANVVVVPLLTAALVALVPLPDPVLVGVVICVAAPGGAVGPLFAGWAKGDLAVAVTAMVLLSVVSVFAAPLIIGLWLGQGVVSGAGRLVVPMMTTLVGVQLLPLLAGIMLRTRMPALADRWVRPVVRLSDLLLVLVVGGIFLTRGWGILSVGWAGIGVGFLATVAAFGFGGLAAPSESWRRSLAIVSAVRHVTLALLFEAVWFTDPLTNATVLSFAMHTLLVPMAMAWWWGRRPLAESARSAGGGWGPGKS